jgi:hypothetical protein
MIARSADFYGPDTRNGVPNLLVFEPFAKQRRASWLVNDAVPHSFTYTPDAAHSLVELAERPSAWNQTWHVPTTPNPPTGKEFIALVAKEFAVAPQYRVLSRPMLRIAGWFDPLVAESYEMLYQSGSLELLLRTVVCAQHETEKRIMSGRRSEFPSGTPAHLPAPPERPRRGAEYPCSGGGCS